MVKLFSKNSNLCDHNSPTSQTDGQTTCDRNSTLCTKVHYRAVKMAVALKLSILFVINNHIRDVGIRLKLVSPGCSLSAYPHHGSTPKGTPLNFDPNRPHPLLTWASQTFDCKLRQNGHNGQPIGNQHHSFRSDGTIDDSLWPPLPTKWGSQMHSLW